MKEIIKFRILLNNHTNADIFFHMLTPTHRHCFNSTGLLQKVVKYQCNILDVFLKRQLRLIWWRLKLLKVSESIKNFYDSLLTESRNLSKRALYENDI